MAAPLSSKALEISRRLLGKEHPRTLAAMHNLAVVYKSAGRFNEAESLELKALEIQRRVLGADHPHTLISLNNLANIYKAAGRLKQAEPLFRQIWQARRKTLTAEHRLTIDGENHLGVCLTMMDRFADAELHLLNSHRDIQRAKDVPPDWLSLYCDRLATLYERWEKPEQSTLWRERLVAAELSRLADMPRDTPKRAGILVNVGLTLLKLHQYDKAEPLLRECHAIREKKLPDNWLLFNAKSLLGGALAGQGKKLSATDKQAADKKFAEAEPLLLAGYEGMKQREEKISADSQVRLTEALKRLIDLYETRTAEGDAEKAEKWKTELDGRQAGSQ